MKAEEIQSGNNITRGNCSGSSTLSHVCSSSENLFDDSDCEKPENLHVCESAENLKVKRSQAGSICCGGGTLQVSEGGDDFGTPQHCNDSDTNLCSGGDTLQSKTKK